MDAENDNNVAAANTHKAVRQALELAALGNPGKALELLRLVAENCVLNEARIIAYQGIAELLQQQGSLHNELPDVLRGLEQVITANLAEGLSNREMKPFEDIKNNLTELRGGLQT